MISRFASFCDTPFEALTINISLHISPSFLGFHISTVHALSAPNVNALFDELILANYPSHCLIFTDS